MNPMYLTAFLCLGAAVSTSGWSGHSDGQWKGEGIAQSQYRGGNNGGYNGGHDDGQWKGQGMAQGQYYGSNAGQYNHNSGAYPHANAHIHGYAQIGHDGRVVDTAAVAQAKAAHMAAHSAAANGGHGWVPAHQTWSGHGHPQGPQDTPEVAQAKAHHYASLAAARGGHHGRW